MNWILNDFLFFKFVKNNFMGLIQLEGMEFFSYHGHYREEQIIGNYFTVDLSIKTDCTKAAQTDDLDDALNYQTAYKIVKNEMQIKSNLLEHIAGRILDSMTQNFTSIEEISVKVSKINPAMGGKIQKVSVTLSK
jgi:dihydroneopterin aldolase